MQMPSVVLRRKNPFSGLSKKSLSQDAFDRFGMTAGGNKTTAGRSIRRITATSLS